MNPLVFPQVPMNQQQFPQFVPCVVPGGAFPPTFQPMYFVQQQNAPVFNQPGQVTRFCLETGYRNRPTLLVLFSTL